MPSPPNNGRAAMRAHHSWEFPLTGLRSLLMPRQAMPGLQPELPFVPPLVRRLRRLPMRRVLADGSFLAVALTSWLLGNLLALLGALVAVLLVLTGGDLDLFFSQLHNLTRRYVEADAGRRVAFQHDLAQAFVITGLVLLLARTPRFLVRLRRELREEVF